MVLLTSNYLFLALLYKDFMAAKLLQTPRLIFDRFDSPNVDRTEFHKRYEIAEHLLNFAALVHLQRKFLIVLHNLPSDPL